jgi:dihydrofolate synthase/folylpolyglutamate synthase
MDHAEYLGSSIAGIAREKAGIFKRGVPAVIGERSPEVRGQLAQLAEDAGASRVCVAAEESWVSEIQMRPEATTFRLQLAKENYSVALGLRGLHQVWNAATAICALRAAGDRFYPPHQLLSTALADVALAGRCQIVGNVVLDVAHNPQGASVLAKCLQDLFPEQKFTVLLCVLADKDWRGIVGELAVVAMRFVLTDAPGVPQARRWNLTEAGSALSQAEIPHVIVPNFDDALRLVGKEQERVLITGSFHTVGDAMSRLQLSPLPR